VKGKFFALLAFLSIASGAADFAFAETSNPVQILVRPSVECYAASDSAGTNKKTTFFIGETVWWVAKVLPVGASYSYAWSGDPDTDAALLTTNAVAISKIYQKKILFYSPQIN